jgi:hypothetical protein
MLSLPRVDHDLRMSVKVRPHGLREQSTAFCPVLSDFPSGYHWSLQQIEYATDLVFERPEDLAPLYDDSSGAGGTEPEGSGGVRLSRRAGRRDVAGRPGAARWSRGRRRCAILRQSGKA